MLAIWTRSKRLACSNRVPERAELAGARLPAGARKGVHGISQFDVDEAGTSDHGLPACARQGPSDSTGPEIDISKGLLWYRSLEADVSDGHTATRSQHPVDLAIDAQLVRAEIDHTIGDHNVGPVVFDRPVFDEALTELDVGQAGPPGQSPAALEHLRSHIDGDHAAGWAHPKRGEEGVHACSGPQVDDPFAWPGATPEERVAHAGKCLTGFLRELIKGGCGIAETKCMRPSGVEVVLGGRILRNLTVLLSHLFAELVEIDQIQDLGHGAFLLRLHPLQSLLNRCHHHDFASEDALILRFQLVGGRRRFTLAPLFAAASTPLPASAHSGNPSVRYRAAYTCSRRVRTASGAKAQ